MAGPLIGALRVSLSAETAQFEAGMKRAQRTTATAATGISKSLGTMKAGLASLAAGLSIGLFTSVIKSSLEYAGSLGELAATLGVTTKDLQEFQFAAGQVGVSQEDLHNALKKLTITLGQMKLGAEAPRKALDALKKGLADQVAAAPDTGAAFRLIAGATENVSDRMKRAAVEVAFFKKSGANIDNLLSGMQGGLNGLSAAAQKLGIVLSDEQINKADETADKLDAMKTVLQARIAGVVADNATAILDLANSFSELVSALVQAAAWLGRVGSEMKRLGNIAPGLANILQVDLMPIVTIVNGIRQLTGSKGGSGGSGEWYAKRAAMPSGDIGKFLAPGAGKAKKGKEDHSAEKALREANQFDQEIRRANIDILNAKKDLATDYVEQTSIAIEIKDSGRAAYVANLQYEVASKERTKVQAAQLLAAYDSKDALERTAILDEEQKQRREDFNHLNDLTFDLQKDRLESESRLAETAQEQRDVQLRLLDLYYRQERARLNAVLADEKATSAEQEEARRRLLNLNKTYSTDRSGVIASTRGPMEDWLASLPTTAAKAQEAMERLEVQGFEGLTDSILALSEGVGSATDSLLATLKQFFLGLARLELQKMLGNTLQSSGGISGIVGAIGGLFGGGGASSGVAASASLIGSAGLPAFATGGSGTFRGIPGIDRNVLSMNGIPFARVSYNERFNFGNDNRQGMGGRGPVIMNVYTPDADSFRRSDGQTTRALKRRLG